MSSARSGLAELPADIALLLGRLRDRRRLSRLVLQQRELVLSLIDPFRQPVRAAPMCPAQPKTLA